MGQRTSILSFCLGLFLLLSTLPALAAKVAVCHHPPEHPSRTKLIRIAASAVPDHLSHGDNVVRPEVCNQIDDDCNGQVDDSVTDTTICSVGVGECKVEGSTACVDGVTICPLVPDAPGMEGSAFAETCTDEKDNDCDGQTDGADSSCVSCTANGDSCDLNDPGACCSLCCVSLVGGGPPSVCCSF